MKYNIFCTVIFAAAIASSVMAKPLIGINVDASGDKSQEQSGIKLSLNYIDAVTSAGGIPILLPPTLNDEAYNRYVELCDGFVFTGGADIDPSYYNTPPHETWNPLHKRREKSDFRLMKKVLEAKKPLIGICLGCQQLNVLTGGSLIQDIPSETSTTINHRQALAKNETIHEVHITTGSKLADLLSTTSLQVNSFHHQAILQPGTSVTVVAKAPDGVAEAIELQDYPFGMGFQWHPEGLTSQTSHLRIFQELVKNAQDFKNKTDIIITEP